MAESSETLKQLPWNIMVPIGSVWSRWNLNNDPETKLKRCGLILAKRRNALFLSLPPKLWQENSIVLEKNGNSYEGVVRKQKLGPWISGRALLGRRRFPWPFVGPGYGLNQAWIGPYLGCVLEMQLSGSHLLAPMATQAGSGQFSILQPITIIIPWAVYQYYSFYSFRF